MSENSDDIKLDTCGCCEADAELSAHYNRPGLSEVSYRIGDQPLFLRRMMQRIHSYEHLSGDNDGQRPLAELTTRDPGDPAIALLDAWATVGDVLTFYQERIVNEGFLGTATERRSVLELARSIGYELSPGVAAQTYLAFTVDSAEGSPDQAVVPRGTQVQSIPAKQGELPQTFETSEEMVAYRHRNAMRPRSMEPQVLAESSSTVYLSGLGLNIKSGGWALLELPNDTTKPRKIVRVQEDSHRQTTRIDFSLEKQIPAHPVYLYVIGKPDPTMPRLELTKDNVSDYVFSASWKEPDLQAFIAYHEWDSDLMLAYIDELRQQTFNVANRKLQLFRETVGFFGNNAPLFKSLPDEIRSTSDTDTDKAYPYDWDESGWSIRKDSLTGEYYRATEEEHLFLEKVVDGLVEDGWLLIKRPGVDADVFKISAVTERSCTGFGLSSKVTGLVVTEPDGASPTISDSFKVRNTVAHVKSEDMALAPLPLTSDIGKESKTLTLDNMVLGLAEGQALSVSGEDADTDGFMRCEILTLKEVSHSGGYTRLTFSDSLAYSYKRDTLAINANVVLAGHGESVDDEVLGSGDGARTNQRFTLRKAPLTHVASASAGAESTLSLRVNGVEWQAVDSLYGQASGAEVYSVRIDNDANASVIFGDGRSGARLPTGQENVVADYRSGIGAVGEVAAGSLTLLKTRPYGVRSVVNPLAASGADDPEKLDEARSNAPLTVLTLERIVSLQDYEDFARAFPGIGKAQAMEVWDGEALKVHITVADADGDAVVEPLYGNLVEAIEIARDPLSEVVLSSYQPFVFFITARVLTDQRYTWGKVKAQIEARLKNAFSFENRAFGQQVTAAELMQVIHAVDGVTAVDIDELFKTTPDETLSDGSVYNTVLNANVARYDQTEKAILAAELLLIHEFGIHLSEMDS